MILAIAILILELLALLIGIELRRYAIMRNTWTALVEVVIAVLLAVTTATIIYIILIALGIV